MTDKANRDDNQRLEALYQEHGEAEPDAGLDWRIRARAHREARGSRLPRPAHWLGGLAVAASLFVVVSVVTQFEPPQAEFPEAASVPEEPAAEVRLEAAESANRRPASADARRQGSAPARGDRAAGFEPAPPPDMATRAAPAARADRASDAQLDDARSRVLEGLENDRVPLNPELGFSEAKALPEVEEGDAARRQIWLIEQYLAVGNAEQARIAIERFRSAFPDRELPPEILAALQALESGAGAPDSD